MQNATQSKVDDYFFSSNITCMCNYTIQAFHVPTHIVYVQSVRGNNGMEPI